MQVIYEPRGRAAEYAPLAVNLYTGCRHGCKYCYVPRILRKTREEFHAVSVPRPNILSRLEGDCKKLAAGDDKRPILLCFTCDPYQHGNGRRDGGNERDTLTRDALTLIGSYGLRAKVLTKAGLGPVPDFFRMRRYDIEFGVTISTTTPSVAKVWEPHAAPPGIRIKTIKVAHSWGLRTWISAEPVLVPEDILSLMEELGDTVDTWWVGKLNYVPEIERGIDWAKFHRDVVERGERLGLNVRIKKGLARYT